MTKQLCYALDLADQQNLIAEYEYCHKPGQVPLAVLQSIRSANIENMRIYRTGNRLMMIVDVPESYNPKIKHQADNNNTDVLAWEEKMSKFQRQLPWTKSSAKWTLMTEIFDLSKHAIETKETIE